MRRPAGPALVGAAAAAVLLAGAGAVVLDLGAPPAAFDEDRAVQAFREAAPSAAPVPSPSATSSSPDGPAASAGPTAAATAATTAPPAAPAASAPAAPAPAPAPQERRRPEPGVYRYATTGYESVDAFGGQRHDYPATTPVTYAPSGCGTAQRWQPLEGRVGTLLACEAEQGSVVVSTEQTREFFGQSQTETYRCDPPPLELPADPRPGQTATGRCASDDSTADLTTTVVALEALEVEGQQVPVVRLRITARLSGSTRGSSDREVWLRRTDGLLVRTTSATDTEADTAAGTVRYVEQYELRLLSLTPRR